MPPSLICMNSAISACETLGSLLNKSLKRNLIEINMNEYNILCIYIWHSPGHPHPPPPGMVMVPCPAPCGSGWGGCGWVGMLVDGVVVFANDVESYGICKELYLVREQGKHGRHIA